MELEVFAHGSMCFAYSGRCLISTLQSGRVPNRGSCANDCRFDYELYAANPETGTLFRLDEEEGVGTYIMNAKDLNLASHMKEILDSGVVDSVKIEGRTKTAYYAAATAKAYRMALDDYYNGIEDVDKYQYELESLQTVVIRMLILFQDHLKNMILRVWILLCNLELTKFVVR